MAVVARRMQFTDLVDKVFIYTAAVNMGNAAVGSGTFASVDLSVPGVVLGDIVLAVSAEVDTVDTALIGAVTLADVVTVTVLNNTAGAVDLASATYRVVVLRLSAQNSFV